MPLVIFCGCTARFMSDQVGNPEDRFSQNEAQIIDYELLDMIMLYFDCCSVDGITGDIISFWHFL